MPDRPDLDDPRADAADLDAPDLDRLRDLCARPGPFVSVYLPARSDVVDADERLGRHWQEVERVLTAAGTSGSDLAAYHEALRDHRGGATRWVVGAADGTLVTGALPGLLRAPIVIHDERPAVTPVLAWAQSLVPHVVAVVDRVGAEVLVVEGTRLDGARIDGDTEHIHRGKPGGWSQRRFQQRAENTWEDNATDVAEAVTEAADRVDAGFVALAGDVRAVTFVRDHLPERIDHRVTVVEGSRHASAGRLVDAVIRVENDHAARATVERFQALRGERPDGLAVDELEATLEALRRRQVATLLVVDDAADDERPRVHVLTGDRTLVASDRRTLTDLGHGPDDVTTAPIVDAAVAAALVGGADVHVMPTSPSMPDGVAALLRWPV